MKTLWTIATITFVPLVLWVGGVVISENVKVSLRRKGWDTWLTWIEDQLPTIMRGQPLRQRWWLWLALGFTGGVSLSLWIASDFAALPPVSVSSEDRRVTVVSRAKEAGTYYMGATITSRWGK